MRLYIGFPKNRIGESRSFGFSKCGPQLVVPTSTSSGNLFKGQIWDNALELWNQKLWGLESVSVLISLITIDLERREM